jgi:predicted CoA-binding protein
MGMQELIDEFMAQEKFAIVGASDNPEKYANEIIHDLKDRGYDIYPVNPRLQEIDGIKCYPSLSDLPVKVDVVDLVVPPRVTEKVVEECKRLGLKHIWMQPGAESQEAIDFCNSNGLEVVHDVCVMMSGPNTKKQASD